MKNHGQVLLKRLVKMHYVEKLETLDAQIRLHEVEYQVDHRLPQLESL